MTVFIEVWKSMSVSKWWERSLQSSTFKEGADSFILMNALLHTRAKISLGKEREREHESRAETIPELLE